MEPSIYVAMPVYSSVPTPVVNSLISIFLNLPHSVWLKTTCDSLVSRARNTLAADFLLETDCTHILWWDSDIIATPDQVARLVSHDEAIVGGLYAIKQERRLKWVLNPLHDKPPADNRGLVRVRNIGTGFLLVKREVFEAMRKQLPDIAFSDMYVTGHIEWDFFPVGGIHAGAQPHASVAVVAGSPRAESVRMADVPHANFCSAAAQFGPQKQWI